MSDTSLIIGKLVLWTGFAIVLYAELISKKNIFSLHISHIPRKQKRASFATKESLFFLKVGKVTFFVRKSLLCRYSALSLHSKTVGKLPLSDSFSQGAFALLSLCLRIRRRRKNENKNKAKPTTTNKPD